MTDRRAAIEDALASLEAEEKPEAPSPIAPEPEVKASQDNDQGEDDAQDKPATESSSDTPKQDVKTGEKPDAPVDDAPKTVEDKAPQSWRNAPRSKWATLDPEVRSEVMRREKEISRTLSETANERRVAQSFNQAVQPFMGRIQSMGIEPIQAVHELLKADYTLTTAPKVQRASFMAKLIKDYDIDVVELDRALAGQGPADPVQSRVDQLVQERLKPVMSMVEAHNNNLRQQQEHTQRSLADQIGAMQNDPKFSEFDTVREDMADIIEIAAKRGVHMTLEQAYTRAIAMNPEANQRVNQRTELQRKSEAARDANLRAQRSIAASSSVRGAPGGSIAGVVTSNDRRATIEAAFSQAEGR